MSLAKSPASRWRVLVANRDLTLYLASSLVSQTGDWILDTGVAFQVYLLTHSTLASAAVMLATQIPQVVLGSVAGVIVDRRDRRRMMIGTNLVSAAMIWPLALVHGSGSVWIVVAVAAATNCVAPFFLSAEASILPALTRDPTGLVTVNALHAQVRNVARLIGAALGGVLVTAGGLTALAVADTGSFLLAAGLIVGIRLRRVPTAGTRTRFAVEWRAGVAAIRRSRILVVLTAFFLLRGVGEGTMGTLFAPFVSDVLHADGGAYGRILAAQAVGGILGGVVITIVGRRVTPHALFAWGTLAFGALDLALFLFPLVDRATWPAACIIALVGLPGAALNAGMLTLFQVSTTDLGRGRVYGLLLSGQNAATLASTVLAGTLAGAVGIIPVICTQGVVYIAVGVIALGALTGRSPSRRSPTPEPV